MKELCDFLREKRQFLFFLLFFEGSLCLIYGLYGLPWGTGRLYLPGDSSCDTGISDGRIFQMGKEKTAAADPEKAGRTVS